MKKLWEKCCVFIDECTYTSVITLDTHTHAYMHAPMLLTHTHMATCMRQYMWRLLMHALLHVALHMHDPIHAPMIWTPPVDWIIDASVQLAHKS